MYKHILIPTDGSALSRAAALAGVRLARALGARVTAIFAAPAATPILFHDVLPVGYGTQVQHAKAIEKASSALLAEVVAGYQEHPPGEARDNAAKVARTRDQLRQS